LEVSLAQIIIMEAVIMVGRWKKKMCERSKKDV
jgi:hypothetical protein